MKPVDVIDIFLSEIGDLDLKCNTQFGIQDHEPEMVVIDNWNYERNIRANSTYSGVVTDNDGNAIGEKHSFYSKMSVDLQVRSENELTAMNRQTDIVEKFRRYEHNPSGFHEDMVLFNVNDGGLIDPFFDPTSLRIYKVAQSFEMEFVDTSEYTEDVEPIEEIETNLEIN